MARWSDIPVINALTDQHHPCQVLSDLMTVKEKRGGLNELQVAWVGDGNNVAQSWIDAARVLGFRLTLACPEGYEPSGDVMEGSGKTSAWCMIGQGRGGAHVINTDVWTSMGQDQEMERRLRDFQGFQVDSRLLALARPEALVMHCLPAHRGEEITEEVLEGPNSVVFDQAENKMHLHQAVLEKLILRKI